MSRATAIAMVIATAVLILAFQTVHAQVPATTLHEVGFLVYQDKMADGWPNGWTGGNEKPEQLLWDAIWDSSLGEPHLVIYDIQELAPGADPRQGVVIYNDLVPNRMMLREGKFAFELLAPSNPSPNGTAWRVTSEEVQIVYVQPDKVSVHHPKSGIWTPFVLVGLINSEPSQGISCDEPNLSLTFLPGTGVEIIGRCFTPNSMARFLVYNGYVDWSLPVGVDQNGQISMSTHKYLVDTYISAKDTTGKVSNTVVVTAN